MDVIKHPQFGEVRTKMIKGEPWFVAKDVCDTLGIANSRDSLAKIVDKDEAGVAKIYIRSENGVNQLREVAVINESGLYALIMRSNKPAAKVFRKWVTSEVLPAIRRQGFYVAPTEQMSKREQRAVQANLAKALNDYLTADDRRKIAKKHGATQYEIDTVIAGTRTNNKLMQDLQQRALDNKERELNAYHPDRISEIIKKLSK